MRVTYSACCGNHATVFEQNNVRFCCVEMANGWQSLVGFGVKGSPRTTSREVNIFTSCHPQTNGNCVQGIAEIRFCPWCGEKITVVQTS